MAESKYTLKIQAAVEGQEKIRALSDEVRELGSEAGTQAAQQARALADQLDRLGEEQAAVRQFRALSEAVEASAREQEALRSRADELRPTLDSVNNTVRNLGRAYNQTQTEIAALQRQQDTERGSMDALRQAIRQGVQDQAALRDRTRELKAAIKETGDPTGELAQKLEAVSRETAQLKTRQAAAREELKTLRDQTRQTGTAKKELAGYAKQVGTELKSAQRQARTLGKDYGQAQAKSRQLADEQRDLKAKLSGARGEMDRLGLSTANLERTEKGLEATIRGTTREVGRFKDGLKQAKTGLDATGKSAAKTEGLIGRIKNSSMGARVAVLAVVSAIGAMIRKVGALTQAADTQERAETKLAHTLRTLTDASDAQIQALKDQASALQELTGYGDESTLSAQAMLGTFRLTAEQIGQLTPRLLDMAEAQRKMGAESVDLEAISIALGKAFTSGIGSLSRYGVAMTDSQKAAFKLAGQQEKVRLLAEVLDGNFKGLAESVGDTYGGAARKASGAQGDLAEDMGKQITQNQAVIDLLGTVKEAWKDTSTGIKDSSEEIGQAVAFVANTIEASFGAVRAVWNLSEIAFKSLVLAINVGIQKISEGLAKITFGQLSEEFKKSAEDIAAYNRELRDSIGEDVADLAKAGRTMIDAFDETGKSADKAADKAANLGGAVHRLGEAGEDSAEKLSGLAKSLKAIGLDLEEIQTGLDETSRQQIAAFHEIANASEASGAVIVAAYRKILQEAKSLEVVEQVTREFNQALQDGKVIGEQAEQAHGDLEKAITRLKGAADDATESTDALNGGYRRLYDGSLAVATAAWEIEKAYRAGKLTTEEYAAASDKLAAAFKQERDEAAAAADATRDKNDAGQAAVDVEDAHATAMSSAAGFAADLASWYNALKSSMYGLSEAAGQAFESMMAGADAIDPLRRLQAELSATQGEIIDLKHQAILASNGFSEWFSDTARKAAEVKAAFLEQAYAAETITRQLQGTERATEAQIRAAEQAARGFQLLDRTRLSALQSEIDRVRASAEALADSVSSTLERLRDERDQALGIQGEIAKEERDYATERKQLDEQLKEARLAGQAEVMRQAQEALDLLRGNHERTMAQLRAELAAEQAITDEQARRAGSGATGDGDNTGSGPATRPPAGAAGADGYNTAALPARYSGPTAGEIGDAVGQQVRALTATQDAGLQRLADAIRQRPLAVRLTLDGREITSALLDQIEQSALAAG